MIFNAGNLDTAVSVLALGSSAVAGWRWGLPQVRRQAQRRRDMEIAILGRDAIPANRNTAEPEQPALRPLRELVSEVHHEVFPNSGKSLRDDVVAIRARLDAGDGHFGQHDAKFAEVAERLERLEQMVGDELHTSTEAVANAAEAAKTLIPVLGDAINAIPPDPSA